MNISITYLLTSEQELRTVLLAPAEYFDPIEDGESYETHGVERFQNAYQYLEVPVADIRWTLLDIRRGSSWTRIRTQLLAGAESMLTHREDSDGYEEIIHTTQINQTDSHITRTCKRIEKSWCVWYDAIITDHLDGSQTERRLDADWHEVDRERFDNAQPGRCT
jgi:hypothetical protein